MGVLISDFAQARLGIGALSNLLEVLLDAGFHKSLQQLRDQLPNPEQHQERFQDCWQVHHAAWGEQLRTAIAHHRNVNHSWQFSPEQQQVLQRYYDANQHSSELNLCLKSSPHFGACLPNRYWISSRVALRA